MTKLDWVEAQSKDKTIAEIIQLFKVQRSYSAEKVMKLTAMR